MPNRLASVLPAGVFPPDRGLALPRVAGRRVVDPDTGLTIECIADRALLRHPYPLLSPENADGSLVALHDADYRRYDDFNGHPLVRRTAGGAWVPVLAINTAAWWWSARDPHDMFALVKPEGDTGRPISRLVHLDRAGDAETLLDFHALGHEGHCSPGNGANGADRSDRFLAVQVAPEAGVSARPSAILLVDMLARRVSDALRPRAGTGRVTSRVSASGGWLQVDDGDGGRYLHAIREDGSLGEEREILATGTDGERRRFPGSHSAMLIDADGDDVLVCDWGGGESFMIRCRDLAIGRLPATGWGHIGVAATDGWCVDYSYGGGGTGGRGAIELVPLVRGRGEPEAQPLDTGAPVTVVPAADRGEVVHVAHHGSGEAYEVQPHASQGASGRVYWTSDAGGSTRELVAWRAVPGR